MPHPPEHEGSAAGRAETESGFASGTPRVLFRGAYAGLGAPRGLSPWDISPDGKRFLMMKEPGSAASGGAGPRKINIVLNWLEELKHRAPAK